MKNVGEGNSKREIFRITKTGEVYWLHPKKGGELVQAKCDEDLVKALYEVLSGMTVKEE